MIQHIGFGKKIIYDFKAQTTSKAGKTKRFFTGKNKEVRKIEEILQAIQNF